MKPYKQEPDTPAGRVKGAAKKLWDEPVVKLFALVVVVGWVAWAIVAC